MTELDPRRATSSFQVALPLEDAFVLFTPEGERRWAEGWDPTPPPAGVADTAVGRVFLTEHGGARTTWIVASCTPPTTITYARVDDRAGLVTVSLHAGDATTTTVEVTYVLTALTDHAEMALDSFFAHYDDEIAGWSTEIDHALHGPTGCLSH